MTIIHVQQLKDIELDKWVARSLGWKVVGKGLSTYCPESGTPQVQPEQSATRDSSFPTHERYFCYKECGCDLIAQMHREMQQMIPDLEEPQHVLGHYWNCLTTVPSYSTDWHCGGYMIDEYNIVIMPDGLHNAEKKDNSTENAENNAEKSGRIASTFNQVPAYTMRGDTSLEAAMRVIVALAFGDVFESEEYNITQLYRKK